MALSDIFQKQAIMRKVCIAITPLFIYSMLLYGIFPLIQVAVAMITAVLAEWFFEKMRGKKTTEAVLVTAYLYGLSLPPRLPLWMNVVGIVFAVIVVKCMFGGFGRNIYNPAAGGRLFIYLSFPVALTTVNWLPILPFMQGFANVFGTFPMEGVADAISTATPLASLQQGTIPPLAHLFFGLRSGSIGEGAIFLLILATIYLVTTKVANWRPIISTLLGATLTLIITYALGLMPGFSGESLAVSSGLSVVLAHLMSGSIFYVAVFMATDPITGPNKAPAQWIYGIIIGSVAIIIRLFSGFPEGTSFAIMIANTFACLLDEIIPKKARTAVKKENA